MYRFFVSPDQTLGDCIPIGGSDFNHIKHVLRMKIGEEIIISNGQDREYYCIIELFETDQVIARITDVVENSVELSTKITLFQGLPKSDKMELIIQKAVELGVYEVIPVVSKRTIVKLDDKKEAKKRERWNTIALSAAKQAKRGMIPKVSKTMTWKEALSYATTLDMSIMPYEDARGISHSREVIKSIKGKKSLGIFIGPEGGFDESEVATANELGIECVTLGKRILRTETAGLTILSIIMFELEEDE